MFLKINNVLEESKLRENILSWYPFKSEATVLEIGANTGEITGVLCEKCSKVYSIEENQEKKKKIENRHKEKEN